MFFIVSKVLWLFLQPSNLILILLLGGLALMARPRWRSAGRKLFGVGVAGFVIAGFSPIPSLLLAPLESRFERPDLTQGPDVAGIIILGGAEDARPGTPRELGGLNDAAERLTEGAALALRWPAAQVVFTGGNGHLIKDVPAEAATTGGVLTALGVKAERLILEDKARNTRENASFTKAKINPKPGERWLLVTSAFHMPRSMGCFRKAGLTVEPWPVDYRTGDDLWEFSIYYPEGLRRMDTVVREYIGLVAYALAGHTTALFPR